MHLYTCYTICLPLFQIIYGFQIWICETLLAYIGGALINRWNTAIYLKQQNTRNLALTFLRTVTQLFRTREGITHLHLQKISSEKTRDEMCRQNAVIQSEIKITDPFTFIFYFFFLQFCFENFYQHERFCLFTCSQFKLNSFYICMYG